jgi:hypothetical protein
VKFIVSTLLVLAFGLAACGSNGGSEVRLETGEPHEPAAEWCEQIWPRHPNCVQELTNYPNTIEGRREAFLTWLRDCDSTGGVFRNC